MTPCIPLPDQIDCHSELAPLVILEVALEVTDNAFFAAYPELWLEDEDGRPLADNVPVPIHKLLDQAARLRRAIARYRSMLDKREAEERKAAEDPDNIPF
jgi:hypothetical protein